MFYDASVGGIDPLSSSGTGGISSQRGATERDITGCEIRANLAGFQSDSIVLTFRRSLERRVLAIRFSFVGMKRVVMEAGLDRCRGAPRTLPA